MNHVHWGSRGSLCGARCALRLGVRHARVHRAVRGALPAREPLWFLSALLPSPPPPPVVGVTARHRLVCFSVSLRVGRPVGFKPRGGAGVEGHPLRGGGGYDALVPFGLQPAAPIGRSPLTALPLDPFPAKAVM